MADIQISALTKRFGRLVAVDALDLHVEDGEFVTLLGPSGCGKTTTLRCIAGLEEADGGAIRIGKDVVFSADDRKSVPPERRDIGMVFQSYALWPHMSVFQNVAYPLRRRRLPRSEVRKRVDEILDLVDLAKYSQQSAVRLSGGQQQRVALARAVVARPRIVLYDEPLSNLDAKLRESMRAGIRQLQRQVGTTAVFVTHDQTEALALSDRIVLMRDGRIEQMGTPEEIYDRPASRFAADFMGYENLLRARVVRRDGASATVELTGVGAVVECSVGDFTGDDAILGIRAAAVRLSRQEPTTPGNWISGTVRDVMYIGGELEYHVACGNAVITAKATGGEQIPGDRASRGETVHLAFPAQRTSLLPESTDAVRTTSHDAESAVVGSDVGDSTSLGAVPAARSRL